MKRPYPNAAEFLEQLTKAPTIERRIRIVQRRRQLALKEFPRQLKRLEKLLLRYNPFTILATFGYIDLTYLPNVGRPMTTSGDIEQYHIELIQALILCHDESEFQMRPHDPVKFQELRDLTSYVGYLHSAREFPEPTGTVTKQESTQSFLRSLIKTHTKAVRNWGSEKQTFQVLKQLYAPLEDAIEREFGLPVRGSGH